MSSAHEEQSEKRHESLDLLKSAIREHDNLSRYLVIFDDALLLGFLHGKKYNVSSTLDCLEQYMHIRTEKYKKFTKTYLLPSRASILDIRSMNFLKQMDPLSRTVVYVQCDLWDVNVHSVYETMAYHAFVIDEALRSYLGDTESNEFVMIFNFDGWVLRQGLQFTPRVALQIVDFVVKSVPIRPAAFHLVNAGSLIDFIVRLFKRLIPAKIRNRIFVDSNYAQLHEHLPPAILPKSLGGEMENEDAFRTELPDKIRSQEEFYQKLIQFSD